MKTLMKNRFVLLLAIAIIASAGQTFAQQSLNGIRLQDANSHVLSISAPVGGFSANYNFRFPSAVPAAGALLFSSDGIGQNAWLPAGANGQVLSFSGGLPVWSTLSSLLSGLIEWDLTGNAITLGYNGLLGNYLGTSNNQPLVLATTNILTPQPIEFFTNNAEKMRLTSGGELGIGVTPTAGKLLHVNGTAGTSNVRFASLASATGTTGRVMFATDATGDLQSLAFPASSGQVLSSTTTGALTWIAASTGSVTSVGLSMPSIFTVTNSPVTSTGTLTATLASQAQNLVFASPNGSAGAPTFRALTSGDIPALSYVTSVSMTMPAALFTSPVSGSPVTSSGTLAPALATQSANLIFSGPTSGVPATPTFRAMVTADIPNSILTYAKIQNETNNTILGNVSGGAAAPSEVTSAQLKTLLNLAGTNSGDLTLAGTGTYLSLGAGQVLTQNPIDLSTANATGILAAARFPALTGDVTTVAGSLATTIANNAVTYGKMQAATAVSKLVGSSSAGTALGEISVGTGLVMSGSTLSTSPTTGLFARKTANVTFTSNAVLTADADLTVALLANATYEFSGVIAYNGATASSDLQLALNIPAGASIRWSVDQAGTAFSASSVTGAGGTTTAVSPFHTDGTPSNNQSIFISGIVITGVTAGNLQVYEAQATSSGTNTTTVLANSHLRAIRVQ